MTTNKKNPHHRHSQQQPPTAMPSQTKLQPNQSRPPTQTHKYKHSLIPILTPTTNIDPWTKPNQQPTTTTTNPPQQPPPTTLIKKKKTTTKLGRQLLGTYVDNGLGLGSLLVWQAGAEEWWGVGGKKKSGGGEEKGWVWWRRNVK